MRPTDCLPLGGRSMRFTHALETANQSRHKDALEVGRVGEGLSLGARVAQVALRVEILRNLHRVRRAQVQRSRRLLLQLDRGQRKRPPGSQLTAQMNAKSDRGTIWRLAWSA